MEKNNIHIEKDPERVKILEKIANYESMGKFDQDVEDDPPGRELMPDEINYLDFSLLKRMKSAYAFFLARRFLNKIIREKKIIMNEIEGAENLVALNSGAVLTCNHFNAFDSFVMQLVYDAAKQKKRKFFRIIKEGNYTSFKGFYGFLMRNCNTLPLSSNTATMKKFFFGVTEILKRGNFVLIYPEQSMWWNYRKPKPLKNGAFDFAYKSGVPVVPCFITLDDSDIIGEDGFPVQIYTPHIGAPIYADKNLPKAQACAKMKSENFDFFKKVYEDHYRLPLVYDTADNNLK